MPKKTNYSSINNNNNFAPSTTTKYTFDVELFNSYVNLLLGTWYLTNLLYVVNAPSPGATQAEIEANTLQNENIVKPYIFGATACVTAAAFAEQIINSFRKNNNDNNSLVINKFASVINSFVFNSRYLTDGVGLPLLLAGDKYLSTNVWTLFLVFDLLLISIYMAVISNKRNINEQCINDTCMSTKVGRGAEKVAEVLSRLGNWHNCIRAVNALPTVLFLGMSIYAAGDIENFANSGVNLLQNPIKLAVVFSLSILYGIITSIKLPEEKFTQLKQFQQRAPEKVKGYAQVANYITAVTSLVTFWFVYGFCTEMLGTTVALAAAVTAMTPPAKQFASYAQTKAARFCFASTNTENKALLYADIERADKKPDIKFIAESEQGFAPVF